MATTFVLQPSSWNIEINERVIERQEGEESLKSSYLQNDDPGENFYWLDQRKWLRWWWLSLLAAVYQFVRRLQRVLCPCSGPVKVWLQERFVCAKTVLRNYRNGRKASLCIGYTGWKTIPVCISKVLWWKMFLFFLGKVWYFDKYTLT